MEGLLNAIAGPKQIRIEMRQAHGGATAPRRFLRVKASAPDPANKYLVLIVDCRGGSTVVTDIRNSYSGLATEGHVSIVGVRDVFPEDRADIPKIEQTIASVMPKGPVPASVLLAVMEVEAWFLAEHTHFLRMHPSLTSAAITAAMGFDPAATDPESRNNPAADLDAAYRVAGMAYTKKKARVQRTLDALDYAAMYLDIAARLPRFGSLVATIDAFLT